MKKGKLIILSAPSGAGKTSICKELLNNNKNWKFAVSATTREKRDNEIDGKDYIFMKKDKFEHLEKFGEFVESEWVHGNRYGTLYAPLEEAIEKGDLILLDIDVKGAMNIIEEFPDDMISIFIDPPGFTDSSLAYNFSDNLTNGVLPIKSDTTLDLISSTWASYSLLEIIYKVIMFV